MKSILKKLALCLCTVLWAYSLSSHAQFATFEIGTDTVDAYTAAVDAVTPFTTIGFDGVFENPPNVFIMTPQLPGAPCIIRIDNVTTTGFDATCLIPLEDPVVVRNGPAANFDYLAIANGGVTVPLEVGGGSIEFRSACQNVTAQQFGRCVGTCGAEGFTAVPFTPPFIAPPAVLTQVQTTNNENGLATAPVGEPSFVGASVGNDPGTSVTAAGFNLAIERYEAGVGPLATSENICYLAAETTPTCQSLDFTSLGGPSSVEFQALIGLQNVEGQNTSGVTTDFAVSCFTETPLALASTITRNGGDGAFLRRVSVNSTGITLIMDEDQFRDSERNHTGDEQPAIFAFSEAFTTPVTLSSAKVSRFGRKAAFEWETSAETFHLGFNLWGETSEGWVQLNKKLIKSNGADSGEVQSYSKKVRLNRSQDDEISQFGISSVDNTGHEEFYGPFTEDFAYGEEANNEPVDWTGTRDVFEQSMRESGYVKYNNRWFRGNSNIQKLLTKLDLGVNRLHFEVSVDDAGIHSISASELIALNPSWENSRLSNIALTLNGQAVARHLISDDARLSHDDRIVFNAREVSGSDTPFLENYTYRLSVDATRAIDASRFDGTQIDGLSLSATGLISEKLTTKKLHSAGLTTGDPWYDKRLLSRGNPVSANYTVSFDFPVDVEQAGVLDILLFGGLDFPGDDDDHHVQVSVNQRLVSDVTFNGLVGHSEKILLPAGVLTGADDIITVTVVGDTGYVADVVLVDEITVSAHTSLVNQNKTSFDFTNDDRAQGYRIANNADSGVQVYAYTTTGLLSSVDASNADNTIAFAALPYEVGETNAAELRYAAASAWPTPSRINVVEGQDLHSQETDYLIVAHLTFMGEQLDEFAQFKTDLGFNVRMVSWLDLVTSYGYGNNTPSALDNFLNAANNLYSTDNVLIVGGHTYDYFGITNESIVNFIPSHYRRVSVFEYTATDNPYADLDGDNIPEIAIGRWPVRSIENLQTIVSKTKSWHENRENEQFQNAYLVAQVQDSQNLSFSKQLRARVQLPLSQSEGIDVIEQLNLDELPDDVTDTVSYVRAALAEKINDGTELISFSGHGSATAWGFQNIINTDFIRGLQNQGEPILLMPLACYITHFESVSTNTLAHQWLFAGEQGAAAIHGASVLGKYGENGVFAERYLNKAKQATTLGEAILEAKKESGSQNEILHNWTLLGDPALPIH